MSIRVGLRHMARSAIAIPTDAFRKSHVINPATGAGADYQVKIKAYYNSGPDPDERFTDFNKDITNNPLLTIPYQGADGVLHPDVLYFPDGIDGYKYWMVYTPYPPGTKEEPCIVRSNDGITWTEVGIANPVIARGAYDEVPDPDFLYVSDYSKWFMVYNRHDIGTSNTTFLATSADGKTWAENCELIDGSEAYEKDDSADPFTTEPTMIYEDGWFYVWYCVLNTEANVNNKRWTCLAKFQWDNDTSSVINFSREATNPFLHQAAGGGYDIGQGHIDVSVHDGIYYMFGLRWITASGGRYDICLWTSTDKTTWAYHGMVISHGIAGDWDEQWAYRGGPVTDGVGNVVIISNRVVVYYSGAPPPGTLPDIGVAYSVVYASQVELNSKCRTDFGDVRFTDDDGSELDFWMQEYVDSDYAIFWVEVSDDLSILSATIYIYYGKEGVITTTSNGENTFPLFDHFDDGSLDAGKWTKFEYGGGVVTEPAGTSVFLDVHPFVSDDNAGIVSVATFTSAFAVLIRRKQAVENRFYIGMSFGAGAALDDGGNTPPTGLHQISLRSGYWFRFYDTGHATSLIYRNPVAGAPVAISAGPATWTTCAVYAIWEMRYDQDGKLIWKIDGIDNSSQPTDATFKTDNKNILINQGSFSGGAFGADTDIDYALVRKFVSPEPAQGDWGSEEAAVWPF